MGVPTTPMGPRGGEAVTVSQRDSNISHSLPSSSRPVVLLLIPAAYNLFMPRSGDSGMKVMTG